MISRLQRFLFEGEILRLMGFVVLSKALGLFVQVLLARYFGAGEHYDAYTLAVFLVSYVGAVGGNVYKSIVVPYTIKLRREIGREAVHAFQNATILFFLLPAVAYMLVLILGSDIVVALFRDLPPGTRRLAVTMIRWMAVPGLVLLGVEMAKAVLNLNDHYRLPALMPVANGCAMLGAIVALHGRIGIWSVLVGYALSGCVQIGALVWKSGRLGVLSWCRPALPSGALGKLWSLSWMMLVAQAILTLYHFIDKVFAARLEVGSISAIAYSYTLVSFGVQFFMFSLVVVMFTRMSELISDGRIGELNDYVGDNLERTVRLVVPAAMTVTLAAPQVVRVLFERGEFTPADTVRTASVLALYMTALPAIVSNTMIGRIFFSMQRMGMKILLAIQYLVTNTLGNILLIDRLGVTGLAISTAVTINLHLFLSCWALRSYPEGVEGGRFAATILKHYACGLAVAAVYRFAGLGELAGSAGDTRTLFGALAVVVLKAVFVFGLYAFALLLLRRARGLITRVT